MDQTKLELYFNVDQTISLLALGLTDQAGIPQGEDTKPISACH